MTKFLIILNNPLVLEIVFAILTTLKREFFTQTLVLTKILQFFLFFFLQKMRNQEDCKSFAYTSKPLSSVEEDYPQIT